MGPQAPLYQPLHHFRAAQRRSRTFSLSENRPSTETTARLVSDSNSPLCFLTRLVSGSFSLDLTPNTTCKKSCLSKYRSGKKKETDREGWKEEEERDRIKGKTDGKTERKQIRNAC